MGLGISHTPRSAANVPAATAAAVGNNQKYKVNPDISGVNKNLLGTKANDTADPNGTKYALAVDLARQKLSTEDEVTDRLFRNTVDDLYKELGGEGDPDTVIRGNNALTKAIRGLDEGYDDFLTFTGNMIDKPWDFVAGGIADQVGGKEAGDKLRNLMNGRDIGVATDIGVDLALGATPFGMPLLAAKSLIQNSDDINEAITGKDNITQESLTDTQRAARGGEAALNTALTMIPGAGRAGKVLKGAKKSNIDDAIEALTKEKSEAEKVFPTDAFKKLAKGDSDPEAEVWDKLIQNAEEAETKRLKVPLGERETLDNTIKAADEKIGKLKAMDGKNYLQRILANEAEGGRNIAQAVKNIPSDFRNLRDYENYVTRLSGLEKLPRTQRGVLKQMKDNPKAFGIEGEVGKDQRALAARLANQTREELGRTRLTGAVKRAMQNIENEANPAFRNPMMLQKEREKALEEIAKAKDKNVFGEKFKETSKNGGKMLLGLNGMALQSALAGMASGYYDNLQQGVLSTFENFEQRPFQYMPALMPVGTKRFSMRMNPGLTGKYNSAVPFYAARTAAVGDLIEDQTLDTSRASNEEEMLRRLAALKVGE